MTKAQYLSWFDEVVGPTAPIFRLVPSDKLDWRLTETSFTIGQQLRHIPGSFGFFAKVINKEEWPARSLKEILAANQNHPSSAVEEAVERFHASSGKFKHAVGRLSEEEFQNGMLETPQSGRTYYWRYCAFALEHHIHHLMELHINLKCLGVHANTMTLYGW